MSLKKETNTALFGSKIKKEPFLIDIETPLEEQRAMKVKKNDPDVLLKTTNQTSFGKTFNKILPELEELLKTIYENKQSKNNLTTVLDIVQNRTGFNQKVEHKNIQEELHERTRKQKTGMSMSMKYKPK